MAQQLATIIKLSVKQRLCFDCQHGTTGKFGVWCEFFNMPIWNEKTAHDCAEFNE